MPNIVRICAFQIKGLNKYGHRITWDPDNDNFLDQLNLVENKEKRNYVEMKKLQKELKQMQDAQKPNTVSARNSFVTMLNSLNKAGYAIDKDKTDMLELSLMIKAQIDESHASQNQG